MPYLGKTPSQATRQRYYKTASGGETSISGTMTTGGTLTFNDGEFVDVSVNGVALVAGTDYNTNTANTIAGLSALSANDQVEIIVYDTFSVFGGNVDGDFNINNGNLSLGDSDKIRLGASQDLLIYHDSLNSYIQDTGTGNLRVDASQIQFRNAGGTENLALFTGQGAVNLFHDNTSRLLTTSSGVDITGGFTATDGSTITTADNNAQLTLTSTDTDANSGPRLDFIRNPSQAGADNDFLSAILHRGYNDAGTPELITYAEANVQIIDASDGSEDARFYINTMVAGSGRSRLNILPSETVFNDDSVDVDFRVESDAKTAAFFVEGGGGTDGFIGLNTSTPQKMLHLVKNDSDGIMIFDADGNTTDHQIVFAKDYGTGGTSGGNYFGVGIDGSENDFIIAFDANSQASLAADKILSLTHDGNLAVDGSSSTGGADYAEYFEWSDGNSSSEDRRGYSVVLDGNKVRKATADDAATSIIGVVSATPAYIGDSAWKDWQGKYEKDDYGNYVLEDGERKVSSNFDDTKVYVPRQERKEWGVIGLMGKLRIRKGQPTGDRWLKLRDISDSVEEWLVR